MKTNKYMEMIFKLKCFSDIKQFYPDAKEWTESYGTFKALDKIKDLKDFRNDKNVLCFCPGDGVSPRTAALVACCTKWDSYSVDPMNRRKNRSIERCYELKKRIEDVRYWGRFNQEIVVVLQTHSHARLDDFLSKIPAKRIIVVALECCTPQKISLPNSKCLLQPLFKYRDTRILSPKNLIKIWDFPSALLKK